MQNDYSNNKRIFGGDGCSTAGQHEALINKAWELVNGSLSTGVARGNEKSFVAWVARIRGINLLIKAALQDGALSPKLRGRLRVVQTELNNTVIGVYRETTNERVLGRRVQEMLVRSKRITAGFADLKGELSKVKPGKLVDLQRREKEREARKSLEGYLVRTPGRFRDTDILIAKDSYTGPLPKSAVHESQFKKRLALYEKIGAGKSEVVLTGDEAFKAKTLAAIRKLLTRKEGELLIKVLATNGHEKIEIVPTQRAGDYERPYGHKITVGWSAQPAELCTVENGERTTFVSPDYLVLAHELIHALHDLAGTGQRDVRLEPKGDKRYGNREEEVTINGWREGNQREPICDHAFSEAFGFPLRSDHHGSVAPQNHHEGKDWVEWLVDNDAVGKLKELVEEQYDFKVLGDWCDDNHAIQRALSHGYLGVFDQLVKALKIQPKQVPETVRVRWLWASGSVAFERVKTFFSGVKGLDLTLKRVRLLVQLENNINRFHGK